MTEPIKLPPLPDPFAGETTMKIKSYYVGKPLPGVCKQNAIWGYDGKSSMPLVYLQRPKWITDDEDWNKICNSIAFHAPFDFEINVG